MNQFDTMNFVIVISKKEFYLNFLTTYDLFSLYQDVGSRICVVTKSGIKIPGMDRNGGLLQQEVMASAHPGPVEICKNWSTQSRTPVRAS